MPSPAPLDHIFWHTLTGPHAQYATGAGAARRYARGFSPIIAFADAARPDFAALAPYCAAGEQFYCEGWSGAAPAGWQVDAEARMVRMVWSGALPGADPAPQATALHAGHVAQAVALAALCRPGPFGPRTIELGDYFGVFDDGRLVAMAGERMHVAGLREISGVCTHPDYQGRGLARQLVGKLAIRQAARAETPFLHVMRSNPAAHQLYRRLGFDDYLESVVRVVAPTR